MPVRNEVLVYLLETHYGGNISKLSAVTGFSTQQINSWIKKISVPQTNSVDWIMHKTFAPEFQVIAEYHPVDSLQTEQTVRKQLDVIFRGHKTASGLYAFYDSMANLVYLGKSDGNLFEECCTQIKATLKKGIFPKGAKQPSTRTDVVRYVSAYYVQDSDFEDYAKHIESLILRISKPVLNANIGLLKKAKTPRPG